MGSAGLGAQAGGWARGLCACVEQPASVQLGPGGWQGVPDTCNERASSSVGAKGSGVVGGVGPCCCRRRGEEEGGGHARGAPRCSAGEAQGTGATARQDSALTMAKGRAARRQARAEAAIRPWRQGRKRWHGSQFGRLCANNLQCSRNGGSRSNLLGWAGWSARGEAAPAGWGWWVVKHCGGPMRAARLPGGCSLRACPPWQPQPALRQGGGPAGAVGARH